MRGSIAGLDLLSRLESDYAAPAPSEVADHQKLYGQAQRMIHSPKMAAFDLSTEPQAVRDAYGDSPFALGCLLSRRLVETGVPFVEVVADGWDTHFDNFDTTKQLATTVDQPFAALIADLASRGACSTRRWSSGWANLAARPTSTPATAATIIRRRSTWCWQGGACAAAR